MTAAPAPRWLGTTAERRLFCVLHRAQASPRAAVLVCPPLFHEHARSYRLFALLADALAARGITVLRFDYYGTGDSDGDDADFTLQGAVADSERAFSALQEAADGMPLAVLGVRGGVLPALRLVERHSVAALWLWQPPDSGAACLAELRQRDAERRRLLGHPERKPSEMHLMGFPHHPGLPAELESAHAVPAVPAHAITVLDAAGSTAPFPHGQRIDLVPALHDWVQRPDMGRFPRPPLRDIGARLAATLEDH